MKNEINPKTILISRTDSIGDVVLTLPCCVWIKRQFPDCKLLYFSVFTKDKTPYSFFIK
jgi:ADP-heptose:LPS heptosyltransferase